MQHAFQRHDPHSDPGPHFRERFPRVHLEITCGRAHQRIRHIYPPTFFIGGDSDCDLVLGDPQFSAIHAYLLVTRQGVSIRHLGRAPQLLVNGQPVRRASLCDGSRISTGPYEFIVRVQSAHETSAIVPMNRRRLFVSVAGDSGEGVFEQIGGFLDALPSAGPDIDMRARLSREQGNRDTRRRETATSIGILSPSVKPPEWEHLSTELQVFTR